MNQYASVDEMNAVWAEADARVSMSIRKLETHQIYAGDVGLDAYRKRDYGSIAQSTIDMFESDVSFYINLLRRGILFTRLRFLKSPPNDYSRFEFLTYKVGARYGERIGVLERELPERVDDFVVYDDFLVIFNYFDADGNLLGSSFSRDRKIVADHIALFDSLIKDAIPLGHYEASHRDYLDPTAI